MYMTKGIIDKKKCKDNLITKVIDDKIKTTDIEFIYDIFTTFKDNYNKRINEIKEILQDIDNIKLTFQHLKIIFLLSFFFLLIHPHTPHLIYSNLLHNLYSYLQNI